MSKNHLIGLTMENLQQIFAVKGQPDNTVSRITKLELGFSELQHKVSSGASIAAGSFSKQ